MKNKQRDRDREDRKTDIDIFSLYEENSTIQGMKKKKNSTSPDMKIATIKPKICTNQHNII